MEAAVKPILVLTTCAGLLAGCSSIGTINGVAIDRASVSSMNDPDYCDQHPVRCIVGLAIGLGLVGSLANRDPVDSRD